MIVVKISVDMVANFFSDVCIFNDLLSIVSVLIVVVVCSLQRLFG